MLKKDCAVCLRTANYSETSQVVTLFGRDCGKISAIAKGSKRPKSAFDGPIEIFSFGDIVFAPGRPGKLATLTEFEQRTVFGRLRNNLFALNGSFFTAELLDVFTLEFDPHLELFDAFVRFLTDAQNADGGFSAREGPSDLYYTSFVGNVVMFATVYALSLLWRFPRNRRLA